MNLSYLKNNGLKNARDGHEIERRRHGRILEIVRNEIEQPAKVLLVVHAIAERHGEHILRGDLTERVPELRVGDLEVVVDALAVPVQRFLDRLLAIGLQAAAASPEATDLLHEELLVLEKVRIVLGGDEAFALESRVHHVELGSTGELFSVG